MIHSPTCQHALRALIYLAQRSVKKPALVSSIAAEVSAPRQSLAKILHSLRRTGLVESTRGPGGGYALAKPPQTVTILEVIEAVDGKMNLENTCVLGLDRCDDEVSCALHTHWKRFREEYYDNISRMTLAEAAATLEQKRRTGAG